jgi:protein-S-isoprenylcysteine O-methyltransferase Ste14
MEPRSEDRPGMMQRLSILVSGLVVFSFMHSVLATDAVRSRMGHRAQLYRGLYNILAVLVLLTTLGASRGDFPIVWRARGVARVALLAVEAVALAGFLATVSRFDLPFFLGLRARPRAPEGREPQTSGTYALCRHPLYFFTSTIFSAWPTMDLRWFVVAAWLWVYSYVGSIFEERKLVAAFGDVYRLYRDTHWRLLPFGPHRARGAVVRPAADSKT